MSPLSRLLRRPPEPNGRTLVTRHLVLRPIDEADLPAIASLAGDWEVASMTSRIPYPYTLDDARHWIEGLDDGEFVRAVTHEGVLLGLTGYLPSLDRRSAEIGYWIGKPYWGRGIATEAAAALVSHAFGHERFQRLHCCHFTDNPASQRVIEKLGFSPVGACSCWCEARRREAPALRYALERPRRGILERVRNAEQPR